MALPDITVEANGKRHTLSFPIGALEEIAKVNPYIEELWQAFMGVYTDGRIIYLYKLEELTATIAAGLKWGQADIEAGELIDRIGLAAARQLCADGLALAIRVDGGEESKKKARPVKKASGSAS